MSLLETELDIQNTLVLLGEKLQFPTFYIYGIVDFIFSDMFSGTVEQQIWRVKVSSNDVKLHLIAIDDTFTYSTNNQIFSFQLVRPPIPYGDGWSTLSIDLISTSNL